MAGFAVLVAPDLPPQDLENKFSVFRKLTAKYKQLDQLPTIAKGTGCMAVKFDSDASIHTGIVKDDRTGSWLIATGTVVALEGENHPIKLLLTLLKEYLTKGTKALEGYDGHFALVIYNNLDKSLSVISDAIGLFGIYYCHIGNQLLISSSAMAIATHTQSTPDILAIEHLLRTGRLDGDKTLWNEVKRLLGGTVLCARQRLVEKSVYWSPTFDKSISKLQFKEALDQAINLLTQSFSRTLIREGKTWIDLTGGFDTRLSALVVEKIKVPFITYCMGPEDNIDVLYSQKISKEMGWEYVHTQLPDQWEPDQYSWFNTAFGCGDGRVSILRLATTMRGFLQRNATLKTNVTGVGGENFRGYRWQVQGINIGRTTKVDYDKWLDRIFSQSPAIPINVMRSNRTIEVRQELHDFIKQVCSNYSMLPNTVQVDRFEFARDSGYAGVFLSSAAGVQRSLAPFFFKGLVNFAFSLNYQWKYPKHHIFVRALIEHENKKLASMETTTGGPAEPIRFINCYKFWPLWKSLSNSAVGLGSKKILGKTIKLSRSSHYNGYPLPNWQLALYSYAQSEGLLNISQMNSGALYEPHQFTKYLEQAVKGQFPNIEFLDLVISIEMAMRATGTYIN